MFRGNSLRSGRTETQATYPFLKDILKEHFFEKLKKSQKAQLFGKIISMIIAGESS